MTAARKIACERCGASVEYRPAAGLATLTCPHCGHRQPIVETAAAAKDDYRALLAAALAGESYQAAGVLACATCGAETTVPATAIAERCPFCTAPVTTAARDRLLRPSAVLPFALDEAAARAAVAAWERGLWFSPGRLAPAGGWRLSAVYLPYWSFDWDVTTEYAGARGHVSDNRTTWTDVRGTVRTRLEGSTVFGSRGVDREHGSELEPWDTERVVGFKDDYLQGVRAETSALSVAEAGDLGHRLLERQVTYELERDIGGDRQRIDEQTTRYDAAAVRLVLMPTWVTHFEHQGRRHRVLINARTGEVIGERPVSRPRLWTAALTPVALAVVGAVWLPSLLEWHPTAAWRGHLLAFWLVLGVLGLAGLIVGSLLAGRAKRGGPARQRDLYIARPGAGTSGLQVDPAAMWAGALQGDALGRATLIQITGFAALFVALMPAAVLAMFPDWLMPIVMMHVFSAIALVAFVWAIGRSRTDRRKLLGLDDAKP